MRWQFSIRTILVVITVLAILIVTIVQTQLGIYALVKMGLVPELRITNARVQFQGETYYILDGLKATISSSLWSLNALRTRLSRSLRFL